MKKNSYARKLRQFKTAVANYEQSAVNKSRASLNVLERKIKGLYQSLRLVLGRSFFKKALAGTSFAAVLLFANRVGAQSFSPAVQNPFGYDQLDSLSYLAPASMVDIDGDGDYDMIAGGFAFDGNIFNFIENTGTASSPSFAQDPVEYPFGLVDADTIPALFTFPTTVDIDADGDFDIVTGSYTFPGNEFGLFFNINTGTAINPDFSTAYQNNPFGIVIDSPGEYSIAPAFSDIDNDGDQDLFITDYYGDIRFFQNTGTASAPAFAAAQTNPFNLSGTGSYINTITLSDFDGDGDKDVLVGNGYYTSFMYFENTGTANAPAFATAQTNPFGLDGLSSGASLITLATNPVDMDGDGDKDIVTGFYNYNFNYYQNTSGIGAGLEESLPNFATSVYPSPSSDLISLEITGNKELFSTLEIIDITGKVVFSSAVWMDQIQVKELEVGLYTVKISDKSGKSTQHKIQKI